MLTKTTAIVLRAFRIGENKLVVDFLTQAGGRVACVAVLSRSSRGSLRKQLFQPMMILDIEYDERRNAQLQKLKHARIEVPYATLNTDPLKLSITLFVAEFLYYATRGEQHNPALFTYTVGSMVWLDGCKVPFANFHLVFMMRLTMFVGFFPNTDNYIKGCCFDLRQACFSSNIPMHTDHIDGEDARRVLTLMRMSYDNMRFFRMSRHDRNRIADIILKFYSLHVPDFPELRSLQVLQELWQ